MRPIDQLSDVELRAELDQLRRHIGDARDTIARWKRRSFAIGVALGICVPLGLAAFLIAAIGHSGMGGG